MPRMLPFLQQPVDGQNWICLASCIAMVFEDLGMPIDQNEIAKNILVTNPSNVSERYCNNYLALRFILNHGLTAMFVAVNNPIEALKACKRNSIYSAPCLRFDPSYSNAHYTLFCDFDSKYVYVNDPFLEKSLGQSRALPRNDIREYMQKQNSDRCIFHSYTMMMISPHGSTEKATYKCTACGHEIPIIPCLMPFVKHILCPGDKKHEDGIGWIALARNPRR